MENNKVKTIKRAICFFVVGEKYKKLYSKNFNNFKMYAEKCNAEIVVIDKAIDKTFHRPLLSQKLLIPSNVLQYDEVLFLDLDIIISPNAPSIFEFLPKNKSFGAILDSRGTEEFNETWRHIPRILKETTQDYFVERNFEKNEKLLGSINGGVFVFRPKEVAELFSDYYYSDHNQGVLNSFEETPMAYITQTRGIFKELPIKFNIQVLYKLKGTDDGKKIFETEKKIPKIIRKYYYKYSKNIFYPTKGYKKHINNLLNQSYFLHFAGKFPITK